ncbi:hypothetical protein FOCC_FOCC006574 [Frankliniella occidentalis]|nr:hypothetical protein FOCC_FOCC006574 [Frankliniella occidentalis]
MPKDYRKLYKLYKARCYGLCEENRRLQAIIDRCQKLLSEGTMKLESLSSETSPILTPTSRNMSSSESHSASKADSSIDFEPGSNKWECLDDNEMITYLNHKTPPSCQKNLDKDEGNSAGSAYRKRNHIKTGEVLLETPKKTRDESYATSKRISLGSPQQSAQSNVQKQSPKSSKYQSYSSSDDSMDDSFSLPITHPKTLCASRTPEHVCHQPRCKDHQPVYATKRAIAKMSPASKKLASSTPQQKSPKGV